MTAIRCVEIAPTTPCDKIIVLVVMLVGTGLTAALIVQVTSHFARSGAHSRSEDDGAIKERLSAIESRLDRIIHFLERATDDRG